VEKMENIKKELRSQDTGKVEQKLPKIQPFIKSMETLSKMVKINFSRTLEIKESLQEFEECY
jgi:hypothetical protein